MCEKGIKESKMLGSFVKNLRFL